ncbi:hypothetical protein QFZ78_006538 [Paenibacillus sp. V4I5]|nr:hypothetical protein [Paenibacillus sp. V4I5]
MNHFDCPIFLNNYELCYCNSYNSEYNTRYIVGEDMNKREIGDIQWQQDILQALSQMEQHLTRHFEYQLWNMFDAINQNMLKLFKQLKEQ